ncbi:hypothetical protein BCR36DRAFT_416149 [Piromyces finnis]|uniref:Uncharacterized protein n=1 Tax=Piromyces finnis TaxID=1754191 RepID=A0A1Y1UWN8_9FUNG|nr:hypothetical protein BCR36DRAFT_416149 [Piromyces finnis]|eukprot:ORX42405.1 hypothetical protein BCR36DRAFT_416149 [Piromyces finnis]
MSDEIDIINNEYTNFKVSNNEEIKDSFDIFKIINPEYDYEHGIFEVRYIFRRSLSGAYFNVITKSYWNSIYYEFENVIYDEYGDGIEYSEVVPVSVGIKVRDPWNGKGKKFMLTKRINNEIYTLYFTKSNTKCLIISSIKYMNPELRSKTSLELKHHYLMNKKYNDFYSQIERVENTYKRSVKILSTEKQLEEIKNDDFDKNIMLYSIGCHIGYICKGIPDYTSDSDANIKIKSRYKENEKNVYAIVWFDCEWSYDILNDDEIISKDSNLICAITVRKGETTEQSFRNFKMFFNYVKILSKRGLVYCYSHNGGKVEHILLLKSMIQNFDIGKSSEYDLIACNGTQIKTLKYGKNLIFYDSLLLLSLPVEKLPEVYGLKVNKGHKDWINGKSPKKWYENKIWDYKNKDDIAYCMNDVRIIKQAMEITNKSLEPLVKCQYAIHPDGYKWVLSNTSISSIGKQTIFNTFTDLPNNLLEKSLFLETYHGGRCEMFYHGLIESDNENFIAVTDKVSMYPSVVQDITPGKLLGIQHEIPKENVMWAMDVIIKYKTFYSIPPICRKRNGILISENYDVPTLLFMWNFEYEALKDNIDIIEVKNVYIFDSLDLSPIFSSWYEKKKQAKTPTEKIGPKILMNGTTGGFGQRFVMTQRTLCKNVEELVNKRKLYKYTYYDAFDDWKWLLYDDYINSKTCYQLISFITAKSRFKLWSRMNELLKVDSHAQILYCDTDSVFIKGNKKLMDYIDKNQSDELKDGWDFKQIKKMYIRGLKKYMYYDINGKLVKKISGLNYKNMDDISFEEFQKDNIEAQTEKWVRTYDNKIKIEKKNINFRKIYEKGRILESGIVKPFFSSENIENIAINQ